MPARATGFKWALCGGVTLCLWSIYLEQYRHFWSFWSGFYNFKNLYFLVDFESKDICCRSVKKKIRKKVERKREIDKLTNVTPLRKIKIDCTGKPRKCAGVTFWISSITVKRHNIFGIYLKQIVEWIKANKLLQKLSAVFEKSTNHKA